jgi:protein SCO1/2
MMLAARLAAVALVICLACATRPALATGELRGVVLSVLSDRNEAVVRHDAFGGMPAMTMVFALAPADTVRVHAGDRIEAAVDGRSDPARLNHLHITGHLSDTPHAIRDVQPLVVGDALPQTQFFDQLGRSFGFADFRGKTVLLSFIYTRCTDARMCPLISANFRALQAKLEGLPVHLVEITLDPAFDTPDVLRAYGRRFGADPEHWTLGTGPEKVVTDFAAQFGIAVFADPSAGLVHTERTVVIDRNGRITDMLDVAAWNTDDVVSKIRSLSAVPSNPIARLDYELSKWSAAICGNNLAGYSGLLDLAIVMAILAAGTWILYRAARKIFVEEG